MNPTPLADFFTRAGAVLDPATGTPEHFGDPEREYRAATGAVALADLSSRGRVEVTGADRIKLIQNLCTNDIAKLPPGGGLEAFFLDARGRIVDFATLFALEIALWLDVEPGRAAPLMQHIDRYVIREDVRLADHSADFAQFHVCGPEAPALVGGLLGGPTAEEGLWVKHGKLAGQDCQVRRRDRSVYPGFDILCPANAAIEVWNVLAGTSAIPIGHAVMEVLRIETGLPVYALDFSEENFPQEIGRDEQAISFKKGCYIGQETVARIDSYGHVNKKLFGIRIGERVPLTSGAAVSAGDKRLGAISSSAYSPRLAATLGLAVLRAAGTDPGAPVTVETAAGPKSAVVSALPFPASP